MCTVAIERNIQQSENIFTLVVHMVNIFSLSGVRFAYRRKKDMCTYAVHMKKTAFFKQKLDFWA